LETIRKKVVRCYEKQQLFTPFFGDRRTKSGYHTTWLWANLREHPEIWMPPFKEIHYFSRSPAYASPNWLASERLHSRLFGRQPRDIFWRTWLRSRVREHLRRRNLPLIRWEWRFFFGRYNDDWYASLFEPGQGKVRGEITHAYSILNPKDVEHIKTLMPRVKVIFMLRNPIDRAWSQIRFDKAHDEPLAHLIGFINGAHQTWRSDYVRTIKIWRECFSEEQFLIAFYDQIKHEPQALLSKIGDFLEVGYNELDSQNIHSRVHISAKKNIPPELSIYLTKKYLPQIKQLSQLLGGHAHSWLEEAEQTLSTAPLDQLEVLEQEASSYHRWDDWASYRWARYSEMEACFLIFNPRDSL
jgi:hypothetical protein